MADPATTRLANSVGYVYKDSDSYTKFEDEEGRGMVTDAYSTSRTYDKGALCIYDNKLYKATSAIGTAEVWTPDHWSQTDINTELGAVNGAIGSTDISGIGDGSITGALSSLNADLPEWTYKDVYHPQAIHIVNVGDGKDLNYSTPYDIVKLSWQSIDTLSSPSQLTHSGFIGFGNASSSINNNATNKFTDYSTGDFSGYLFAKPDHINSTSGCMYGTFVITSARWNSRLWVARIWQYEFTNFWMIGS